MVRTFIEFDLDSSHPCMSDMLGRVMDMASQFRHVRFSGVDIGTYMARCFRFASPTLLAARSQG